MVVSPLSLKWSLTLLCITTVSHIISEIFIRFNVIVLLITIIIELFPL